MFRYINKRIHELARKCAYKHTEISLNACTPAAYISVCVRARLYTSMRRCIRDRVNESLGTYIGSTDV